MISKDLKTISLLELDLDEAFESKANQEDPKAAPCACFTEEECFEAKD